MSIMFTTSPTTTDRHDDRHIHDHVGGLACDLALLGLTTPPRYGRRQLLAYAAGGVSAAALLAACASSDGTATTATTANSASTAAPGTTASTTANTTGTTVPGTTGPTATTAAGAASAGAEIPDETAGPFPGDGTNGPNALTQSGVVRNDMRSSFGSSSTVAAGIETVVALTIVEADTGLPIPGAAVYLWHCDQNGSYSLYDLPDENYLRAVQVADDNGNLTVVTSFPGCYAGRWPHAHFEVYGSLDEATVGSQAIKTSQLAFPESTCNEAYATSGYESSVQNLTRSSLTRDNVFSDGVDDQLVTVTGDPNGGYTASLLIRV